MAFFLISIMVLGLLNQLQIFSQLFLIELLGLLTGLGAVALDVSKVLTEFDMLVFFTNVCIKELQVGYFALFCLFSVIEGFEWFWIESLHKNI